MKRQLCYTLSNCNHEKKIIAKVIDLEKDIKTTHKALERVRQQINRVIIGKDDVVDHLLIALIASGHVLLEDVPGTGKTLLTKTLAQTIACEFKRIQFTPDLLPSDLSGIHFYNQKTGQFEFRAGPLFTNVLLADEINRATPRTQSSLLECMEERQITIDGETMRLQKPFLVIATQNPIESQGTFPLPEAQLDRFFIKIKMGYPATDDSVTILKQDRHESLLTSVEAVLSATELQQIQLLNSKIKVQEDLYHYIVKIVEATRNHPDVEMGVSPRGMQALLRASQARALLQGRPFVTPDDIKAQAVPVLSHLGDE